MEKDIGKIQKNDETNIILRVDDFGGRTGLTIREFVTSERYTGFTKSGVRILAGDFPAFKEMINSVSDEDMKEFPAESNQASTPEGRDSNGRALAEGAAGTSASGSGTPTQGAAGTASTELPKEQETLDEATQDY